MGEHPNKLGLFRSGADQAHVALEHIPELRQFVQAGSADDFAHGSHPVIVGLGKSRSGGFFVPHAAQFPDAELAAVATDANLGKQHRPWRVQLHGQACRQTQRKPQGQRSQRQANVGQALDGVVCRIAVQRP